ncbi:MAG: hypothetical protein ACXWEI_03810, partial [Mycobacterium sp.]
MGAISRGWALTKQSWAVLKNDRSLVIFPILSAIFAMVALAARRGHQGRRGPVRCDAPHRSDPRLD